MMEVIDMKRVKGKLQKNNGQALIETALVLPIIILILMGIIDFGLMFSNYFIVSNASRDAARNAVVGQSDVQTQALIANMTSTLNQEKIKITIYPADSLRKKGDEVSITIEYDNTLLTPIISAIIPNPVKLISKTTMRME